MQALFVQEPVLIVDDDPVQRRLSEATLTRAGFNVVAVDNGKDALTLLENEAFSAVLLDMMMPGIDGAGVLSGLAQMGVATPVVVQTAQGSIDAAVRMVRAGAFDFLVKLNGAEQFYLYFQRQLANFIQKQCALVCFHKLAVVSLIGPCESTLFMAEQNALDQFFRNGPAIDSQKRFRFTVAMGLNGTRHHLFANTGFAFDKHRNI